MLLLEVKDLRYCYPDGSIGLSGVDFTLNYGEKLAVIGANGSGKSTLLMHLTGCFHVPAENGEIWLEGESVGFSEERLREAVGLVFQEPDDQLFMPSVLEDVAFGIISREKNVSKSHEEAMNTLNALSISHLSTRPPHRLSGGEKRMVALAGVLAMNPRIVALDEPSAALDPRARRRVIEFLKTFDRPLILATHDLDMALEVCTRALIMNLGRVTADSEILALMKNTPLLQENGLEPPLSYK